jgi:AcrR family transcriptional regulator
VTQMSKSGVFAHFGSREELQISVVREYHQRFEEEVFLPAIREPRGLPRLRALFTGWVRRVALEMDSGCIYISGAVEFDDRPGPVRDALVAMVSTWHHAMQRAISIAIDEGHFKADADTHQMLFEIHGLILALHYEARFLKNPGSIARANAGFHNILQRYGAAASKPTQKPRSAKSAKE